MKKKTLFPVLFIGALAAALLCFFFFHLYRSTRDIADFRDKTEESRLLGKDLDQIKQMLGVPELDTSNTGAGGHQDFVLLYSGPLGGLCRVEFHDGRVVRVKHFSK